MGLNRRKNNKKSEAKNYTGEKNEGIFQHMTFEFKCKQYKMFPREENKSGRVKIKKKKITKEIVYDANKRVSDTRKKLSLFSPEVKNIENRNTKTWRERFSHGNRLKQLELEDLKYVLYT